MKDEFKTIPNFFSLREPSEANRYFHKDKLLKIQGAIDDDTPNVINIIGHSGFGKTSTVKELRSQNNLNSFFVRFPIANLELGDDRKTFDRMREILLEEINRFQSLRNIQPVGKNYPARIFLSYSRADQDKVIPYYDRLKKNGFIPWMDECDLLPGQDWELAIEEAMKKADFIVLFISKTMVEKRGFIRKEIKQALRHKDEKLPEDIYLIPALLEECEIPNEVCNQQCASLYQEDGFDKLLRAIRYGCQERGLEVRQPKNKPTNYFSLENVEDIISNLIIDFPNAKFIMILDDFDYLLARTTTPALREKFRVLLEKLILDRKFRLIIVSHRAIKKDLTGSDIDFGTVLISEYDLGVYEEGRLIEETRILLDSYIDFQRGTLEDLISSAGGNYYCYQLLFDALIDYLNLNRKNDVSSSDLESIYDFIINSEKRIDFSVFWKSMPIALRLFICLVIDYENPCSFLEVSSLSDKSNLANLFNREEIKEILNYLVEHKYLYEDIQSHPSKFKVIVPLYARWIAKKYRDITLIYREVIEEIFKDPNISKHYLLFGSEERSIRFTQSKEMK